MVLTLADTLRLSSQSGAQDLWVAGPIPGSHLADFKVPFVKTDQSEQTGSDRTFPLPEAEVSKSSTNIMRLHVFICDMSMALRNVQQGVHL